MSRPTPSSFPETDQVDAVTPEGYTLAKPAMILLSLFAAVHVLAIFAEPYRFSSAVGSPGPAPHAAAFRRVLRPYVEAMYLSHGYYFFAPSPGPSHLVVAIDRGSGPETRRDFDPSVSDLPTRVLYPDRRMQRPRLLYHRYFMFTEFFNTLFTPADIPNMAEDGTALPEEVRRGQVLYAEVRRSLLEHLRAKYGREYEVFRVEHHMPAAAEYFAVGPDRVTLTDPRLYVELPETYQPPQLPDELPPGLEPQPVPYRMPGPAPYRAPAFDRPSAPGPYRPGVESTLGPAAGGGTAVIVDYIKGLARDAAHSWPRFWFAPTTGYSLAIVRIAAGLMLAYVHAVWWLRVGEFFGPDAMIDLAANHRIHELDYTFSYLRATDSLAVLWAHQFLAVLASLALAAGLLTRLAAPLAWFMTLNVCHRATGYLFGLDQTAMMLAFALTFAPSGAVLGVDAFLRKRWLGRIRPGSSLDWLLPSAGASSMNTFATRLIQLQLCAIYLFGGLGKVRGGPWWDGTAIWLAAASWEYQSNDMTWIGRFPWLAAVLAHVTIFWETFYCVAVWPLRSRPIVLALAVAVHAGIGIFLGMITFAAIMIAANVAFVPPEFTRRILSGGRRSPSPTA